MAQIGTGELLAQGVSRLRKKGGGLDDLRMQLSAEQIRAARALLDWSQTDLADRTLLGMRTVKRAEAGERLTAAADLSIRKCLEEAGVVFLAPGSIPGMTLIAGVALVAPKR